MNLNSIFIIIKRVTMEFFTRFSPMENNTLNVATRDRHMNKNIFLYLLLLIKFCVMKAISDTFIPILMTSIEWKFIYETNWNHFRLTIHRNLFTCEIQQKKTTKSNLQFKLKTLSVFCKQVHVLLLHKKGSNTEINIWLGRHKIWA